MYHIKNDRRCLKSAEKIRTAYRELMRVKALADISITDIQKKSRIGRATFYRLFDNTDDVLLYLLEEEFRGVADMYRELDWQEFTGRFIEGVISGSRELLNITEAGKIHLISKAVRTNLTHEAERSNIGDGNQQAYMIAIFVGACISLVNAWEENGREESIEELVHLIRQTLNYGVIEAKLRKLAGGME